MRRRIAPSARNVQEIEGATADSSVRASTSVGRSSTPSHVAGLGPIRAAHVVAAVLAPEQFRTKQQFWSYCGLGLVTNLFGRSR
ncbi:transposase [Sorangium sp. So ce394]|uniref:transposase n=1 Tax=Sorangium sp. So ce394 TaxID=3133310 RepID=UPI003F5C1C59